MSPRDRHQDTPPGTLHAKSTLGAIQVRPEPGRIIRFGRGGKEADARVDLLVGADDQGVSRRHGELTYQQGYWWLRNTGRQHIRLPYSRWLPDLLEDTDDPVALEIGHTQLYVKGSPNREHPVDLYVAGDMPRKDPPPDATTIKREPWKLAEDERLVLVVMGQRYLRNDPDRRPLTYRETAIELEAMHLEEIWGADWAEIRRELPPDKLHEKLKRRIEYTVEKVRHRLADGRVSGVKREPGGPSDDRLKRNLLEELVESRTLVRADLDRLDDTTS